MNLFCLKKTHIVIHNELTRNHIKVVQYEISITSPPRGQSNVVRFHRVGIGVVQEWHRFTLFVHSQSISVEVDGEGAVALAVQDVIFLVLLQVCCLFAPSDDRIGVTPSADS